MATTDALLRRGLERHGNDVILTVDPVFQGLPDTAHGGSVLAAFRVLVAGDGPREVRGLYRKRVPLGVPLRLVTAAAEGELACRLLDGSNAVLVEGRVTVPAADVPTSPAPPVPVDPRPLPVSTTCFACGVDNALGLRVRLGHDDAGVGGVWRPHGAFRAADGTLAPVALTTLLDEAAFWVGALASGESGMTTELIVTLRAEVPFGGAITVGGPRAARPRADDPRYWDTEVAAWDQAGRLVASARITFVAVRGAARRLAAWLLRVNPPDVVHRVFPSYA